MCTIKKKNLRKKNILKNGASRISCAAGGLTTQDKKNRKKSNEMGPSNHLFTKIQK